MVQNGIDPNVYKDSRTLRYPPNINTLLALQFWYPRVGSLIPLFMLIVDTMHSPIYRSNIGTYLSNTDTESERFSPLVAAIKLHAILKPSRVMSLLKIQHPIQFSANAILLFSSQNYQQNNNKNIRHHFQLIYTLGQLNASHKKLELLHCNQNSQKSTSPMPKGSSNPPITCKMSPQ